MNKINTTTVLLTISGILLISLSQIVAHYFTLPDFIQGGIMGVGIGIMALALILRKRSTHTS